ncbi:ribose-phosphate pyrophosphokinase-like domain-containing protein [Roseomonas tokyonensis]|nr:ribose-phosphate pyrophosphokinase-like domain-containing protein [Falsiroseomonas tokyonensis]
METGDPLAARLAAALSAELGTLETRRFPDGETWLRHASRLTGRRVILLAALDRPDAKALPLLFAADAARELGAIEVGLVAPYLPYMRQDRRFRDGEAVTSTSFAAFLSRCAVMTSMAGHAPSVWGKMTMQIHAGRPYLAPFTGLALAHRFRLLMALCFVVLAIMLG